MQQRERAIGMLRAGLNRGEVARRLRCHRSTISRLSTREHETGTVADRPRPGQPRVTTQAQDRYIALQHTRDRFRTATQTARETPGNRGPRVSPNTIRRRLHQRGMHAQIPYRGPILTPIARRNRLRWAELHRRWRLMEWNTVLFSDESRFCIDRPDRRQHVWRRRGERFGDACVRQGNRWGGASVMVWAGITARRRTPLVIVDGNLTAQRYVDHIIRPVLLPFLQANDDVTTFQQDNARAHSARLTQNFLRENNVTVMEWPPYSPDLSPIEHLWDQLKTAVAERQPAPRNRPQLIQVLQEEWDWIPQDRIMRLVRSMRRRCTACCDARGGHTRY